MFIFHPFRYGVAGKKEFWITSVGLLVCNELVAFIIGFLNAFMRNLAVRLNVDLGTVTSVVMPILALLVAVYLLILQVSIRVRRLHDAGYSGWWVILVQACIYVLQAVFTYAFVYQSQSHATFLGVNSAYWLNDMIVFGLHLVAVTILGLFPTKLTNNPYPDKALRRNESEV
ncbi:MAG: DUF805 domain-containing protein [Neisseriaceae bacterium]